MKEVKIGGALCTCSVSLLKSTAIPGRLRANTADGIAIMKKRRSGNVWREYLNFQNFERNKNNVPVLISLW